MSKYPNEESDAPINGKELDDKNHTSLKNITTLQATELSTGFDPIQRIKEGFNHFKINECNKHPDYYRKLEEKQEPKLKDLGVGSIIQAATLVFKVEVIMVIGHRRCGGIKRLVALPNEEPHDLIDYWLTIGQPVKAKVLAEHPNASDEELHTLVEKESLRNSLVNLLSYPYVRSSVANKKLKLMGGYYDFMSGKFEISEVDYDIKPTIEI